MLIVVQVAVFAAQFAIFLILQKRRGPVYISLLGAVAAAVGVPIAVVVPGEVPPAGLGTGGA